MTTIRHPLIRDGSLDEREYQLALAIRALDGNSMCVLPTGLGKTAVALIAAASRLYTERGRVLVLAPTKPLVEQHLRFFEKHLALPDAAEGDGSFAIFTGEAPPDERKAAWERCRVCCATPQVVKNDVLAGRYDLADVTLLVVDECHRAVGNYAYVFIAERYRTSGRSPLLLAMTASPGGDPAKVKEVCENLGIRIVQSRTEDDPDVAPYVHEREIQVVTVDLPPELAAALEDLYVLLDARLAQLAKLHFIAPKREKLTMRALSALNVQIQKRIADRDRTAFLAASLYAECMKLRHACVLAEAQGSVALGHYLDKLAAEGRSGRGSKAAQRLAEDPVFQRLLSRSERWSAEIHPKLPLLEACVRAQLEEAPESRIIVFATYRDTVQLLVDHLNRQGILCERFVGQATKDEEKGLSQRQQIAALDRFRAGEFRVLVATSVGEEGLDVPSTDMVIFYEAVPSEIRSIQRKGRTGRSGAGRCIVLVTKGTQDEAYRYVSQRKERAMVDGMKTMSAFAARRPGPGQQLPLDAFVPSGPRIIADDRETSSRVVERLSSLGIPLEIRRLDVGDYAIGSRILVERKTTRDFLDTLVDRDLLGQLRTLAETAARPVLIVEGGDLHAERNIHPNAIRGTLVAIAIDMGIACFFTQNDEETAELLAVIARREDDHSPGERKVHPHKSYRSIREQQENIVAAFPGVGLRSARILLAELGTIQGIVDAEKEDLFAIKGIGKKTAESVHDLARRGYQ